MDKLAIIGSGGFGREVLEIIIRDKLYTRNNISFFDQKKYIKSSSINEINVKSIESFNPQKYKAIVCIGDSKNRKNIINKLPENTNFTNIISLKSSISKNLNMGFGNVIMDFCYLTDNVKIGDFCIINNNSSIGHDTVIQNYVTISAGVRISGNCLIKSNVSFGHNASTLQGITVNKNIIIGMNSSVYKNLNEPGTYFGSPLKRIF